MKDLGLSDNLDMQYGLWVSNTFSENVKRTLKHFGFSSGGSGRANFNFNIAKQELDNGYPVFMSSLGKNQEGEYLGGHAWILHGMMRAITPVNCYYSREEYLAGGTPCQVEMDTTYYLQYNWGWDGGSDGYYIYGRNANCYNGPHYKEPNTVDSIAPWGIYMPKDLKMFYGFRK